MPYDFLEIYDYENFDSKCEQVCSYFDEIYDQEGQGALGRRNKSLTTPLNLGGGWKTNKNSGLSYFNKRRQKICATKSFNFGEDWPCNELVYSFIHKSVSSYVEKYPYLTKLNETSHWRLCPSYNIQRYIGEEEGFFNLHNENSGSHPYRMLVWMVYLNDAKCGTEFPYQERTAIPKTGRTVIWPADWTHPHKGVTPNQGTKYIATGWFYFLPKGDAPKFDGHHPDEENIKEIVV